MRVANARTNARRQVNRLFLRVRRRVLPQTDGAIEVNYARRFQQGEAIIAVSVPICKISWLTFLLAAHAHKGYHYPPAVINGRDKHRLLRLIFRFRKIGPDEQERLLRYAEMVAEWAEELFCLPATVVPIGGLVDARMRLRAINVAR